MIEEQVMIQGRVDRKEGGRETGRGNGEGAMGRGRWERLRWGDGEEEGKVEKSWQGPGVGRKGRARRSGVGRGRQDWDNREETGRGQWGREDGEGATGRGDGREAKGMDRRRGKRRRHFTDGYDSSTWNAWVEWGYSFFWLMVALFTRATPGTQLIYTNKIGDCLFIYLSVRLWTAKPQGLTCWNLVDRCKITWWWMWARCRWPQTSS